MTSKDRAYLRSLANTIEPIFQVGKGGISDNLIKQVDDALEARELIKLTVLETSPEDGIDIGNELSEKTNSILVQVVGRKITLYRKRKKDSKINIQQFYVLNPFVKKLTNWVHFYYPLHGHTKQSFKAMHNSNPTKLNKVVNANAVSSPNNIAIAIDAVAIVIDKAITPVIIVCC